MINVIVQGVALASVWFWVYSLLKSDEKNMRVLAWWAKVIIPQGIIIALALNLIGVL